MTRGGYIKPCRQTWKRCVNYIPGPMSRLRVRITLRETKPGASRRRKKMHSQETDKQFQKAGLLEWPSSLPNWNGLTGKIKVCRAFFAFLIYIDSWQVRTTNLKFDEIVIDFQMFSFTVAFNIHCEIPLVSRKSVISGTQYRWILQHRDIVNCDAFNPLSLANIMKVLCLKGRKNYQMKLLLFFIYLFVDCNKAS